MSKSETATNCRLPHWCETLRTKSSTESVIMNYRWKPDLHQIVSLRKGTGQPVCQWKRQDLLLLRCQKLQEQQIILIRMHKRYPESSNRKNCPHHKEKGDARDNLTLCSNLPPDCKMVHVNRWWEQTLQKTGLPRVCLINLQQLRLVSFKLCQRCAARHANTEPFQEPAKPLQTYAVCSQGCVRTVRHLCMCKRVLPAPDRLISSARHEPPFTNRISVRDQDRHPHLHLVCVCKPCVWRRPARKEGPHWSNSVKSPPPTDPFHTCWGNTAQLSLCNYTVLRDKGAPSTPPRWQ